MTTDSPDVEAREASLEIYVTSDVDNIPGRPQRSCNWRGGGICRNQASILVHLAETDDGSGVEYCQPHAVVTVNAAVTNMWQRFNRQGSE